MSFQLQDPGSGTLVHRVSLPSKVKLGPDFWDTLNQLRSSGTLCDVQLCISPEGAQTDTVSFPAHKLVLVGSSLYFQKLLAQDEQLDVFNFDGISPDNLQVVLDYIYRRISWKTLQANPEATSVANVLEIIRHDARESASKTKRQRIILPPSDIDVILQQGKSEKRPAQPSENHGVQYDAASSSSQDTAAALTAHVINKQTDKQTDVTAEGLIQTIAEAQDGYFVIDPVGVVKIEAAEGSTSPDQDSTSQSGIAAETVQEMDSAEAWNATPEDKTEVAGDGVTTARQQEAEEDEMEEDKEGEKEEDSKPKKVMMISPESTGDKTESKDTSVSQEQIQQQRTSEMNTPQTRGSRHRTEAAKSSQEIRGNADEGTGSKHAVTAETVVRDAGGRVSTRSATKVVASSTSSSDATNVGHFSQRMTRKASKEGKVKETVSTVSTSTLPAAALTDSPRRSSRSTVSKTPARYRNEDWVIDQPATTAVKTLDLEKTSVTKAEGFQIEEKSTNPQADDVLEGGERTEGLDLDPDFQPDSDSEEERERVAGESNDETKEDLDQEMMESSDAEDFPAVAEIKTEAEDPSYDDNSTQHRPQRRQRTARGDIVNKLSPGKDPTARSGQGLPCQHCDKIFKNTVGLSNHTLWHHSGKKVKRDGDSPHECSHCHKILKSFTALLGHERKMHNILRDFVCKHCDQAFRSKKLLKLHLLDAHQMGLLFCEVCGSKFRTREGHRIHMFKQHSLETPSQMCDTCGKVFLRRAELKSHIKYTHTEERNHTCMLCSRSFKAPTTLRRHLRTYHSDLREHQCDICQAMFKTKSDLGSHRRKHFREEAPLKAQKQAADCTYSCSECGKTFKRKSHCQLHQKMQHTEQNSGIMFKCGACMKTFQHKNYLLAHINQCHTPKRYSCAKCLQEFTHKYLERKHQTQGRCKGYPATFKPYKCGRCNMTFTLKGNLTKHLAKPKRCKIRSGPLEYMVVVDEKAAERQTEAATQQVALEALGEAAILRCASQGDRMSDQHRQTALTIVPSETPVNAEHDIVVTQGSEDDQQVTFTIEKAPGQGQGQLSEDMLNGQISCSVDDVEKSVIFVTEDGTPISTTELPAEMQQQIAAEISEGNIIHMKAEQDGSTVRVCETSEPSDGQVVLTVIAPDGSTEQEVMAEVIEHLNVTNSQQNLDI